MIPPVIDPGCRSPGEREVFRRLRDDPRTGDWLVLHSLDVANHNVRISGEIDFLVIIPSVGVLCLEVKSHRRIRRDEGRWYYGSRSDGEVRGPFKQASEAMHSLRTRLAKSRKDLSRIVFWSAVLFPYAPFRQQSEEWHSWQVIDGPAFRSGRLSDLIEGVLNNARTFLQNDGRAPWFIPALGEPTPDQCRALLSLLRRDFEFFESPALRAYRQSEEVKRYTEEQFIALDAMDANPRVLFTGPAGTGKTLLAVEAARRSAAAGRRVLLACFNRHLGGWLEDQVTGSGIVAGTLHRHMMEISGRKPRPRDPRFWEEELPEAAMEKLIENPHERLLFDELVVDEAQDLFRDEYLDFLDLSLKGGLGAGRWRIFGDFEKQAIYGSDGLTVDDFLEKRGSRAPRYSLRINCRNTPRIAEFAHLLGGLAPGYRRILRPDDGVNPEVRYYANATEQRELLVEAMEELFGDGFRGQEVVVLSRKASGACASSVTETPWRDRLKPLDEATGGHVGYCSIHAFKGMEAPAVVITDVDRIADSASVALFYVAITRPLHRLTILMHERVKEDIARALLVPDEEKQEGEDVARSR